MPWLVPPGGSALSARAVRQLSHRPGSGTWCAMGRYLGHRPSCAPGRAARGRNSPHKTHRWPTTASGRGNSPARSWTAMGADPPDYPRRKRVAPARAMAPGQRPERRGRATHADVAAGWPPQRRAGLPNAVWSASSCRPNRIVRKMCVSKLICAQGKPYPETYTLQGESPFVRRGANREPKLALRSQRPGVCGSGGSQGTCSPNPPRGDCLV